MPTPSHPYEFKLIKAREITVDRLYQRKIQKTMVKEITNNFDYHKVNCVKVIFRDGQYFAFDGQQTTTGLRSKFGDNYMVPCLVYYDVPSWIDEAELFEGTNKKTARKAVGVRDLWTSRLNRGEEAAVNIQRIVERHHMILRVKNHGSDKTGLIQCLDVLEKAYQVLGPGPFEEMMEILDEAWHGTPESISAAMIGGMSCFVKVFYGKYDKKRLIGKLRYPTSLGVIISGGSAGSRKGPTKYAAEIVSVYNDHLREDSPKYLNVKDI